MDEKILRIIDANFNRAREGLRVCEEVVRFTLADETLTGKLKKIRHDLSGRLRTFPGGPGRLLDSRDVSADAGREAEETERREGAAGVFLANVQRVKESLRVLEEFGRTEDPGLAAEIKRLRFEVYDLEKEIGRRLATLLDH